MINREFWEGTFGEFFADAGGFEADFVDVVFVFQDGEIVGEAFNVVKSPSIIEEITIRESIFETIGGETGNVVVGDGEEMIVGNFAGEDAVFFELAHDGARVTDDLASFFFGRFLDFFVAIHEIDAMFKSRRRDIVEEGGESLAFVTSEAPDDERDADAVLEDGMESGEVIEATVIKTASHADGAEALHLGGGEIFQEPSWKFGRENLEIFAHGRGEAAEAAFFRSAKVDGFFVGAGEELCARSRDGRRGDDRFVLEFGDNIVFGDFDFFGLFFGGRLGGSFGDRNGSFFAGWAVIDMNPTLVKPEADFFVTSLFDGRGLEEIDFDLFPAIEIRDERITQLGESTRANIATDVVVVFVHEEKDIGTIDVLIKRSINIGEILGTFGCSDARVINDLVTTTLKITSPVSGTFLKF